MPMPTHTHGFWVGMGAMLLFMGGHRSLLMVMVWVWVQILRKMLGSNIKGSNNKLQGLRATSPTRLKALDHGNVRALIGRKGEDRPSSLHTRR